MPGRGAPDAVLGFALATFASFTWVATLPGFGSHGTDRSEWSPTQILLVLLALTGVWFGCRAVEVTGRIIACCVVAANCLTLVSAAQFAAHLSPRLAADFDGQGYAEVGLAIGVAATVAYVARMLVLRVARRRATCPDRYGPPTGDAGSSTVLASERSPV